MEMTKVRKSILIVELERIEKKLHEYKFTCKDDLELLHKDLMLIVKSCRECEKSKEEKQCSICLDEIGEKNMCVLDCGHSYHLTCILDLKEESAEYSNRCPNCRSEIEREDNIKILKKIHELTRKMTNQMGMLLHRVTHMTNTEIEFFGSML